MSSLPVRVLSRLFRRLFLKGLAALHETGRLTFFGDLAPLIAHVAVALSRPRLLLSHGSQGLLRFTA